MLTKLPFTNTLSKASNESDYALLRLEFFNKASLDQTRLSIAVLKAKRVDSEEFMGVPDYAMLVSRAYSSELYSYFLRIIIDTPNLIPEEHEKAEDAEIGVQINLNSSTKAWVEGESKKDLLKVPGGPRGFSADSETQISVQTPVTTTYKADFSQTNPSLLTSDIHDPETLTDDQIQALIVLKMSQLDRYNNKLENKEANRLIRKYKLTPATIASIKKMQAVVRGWILKRKFFTALRMNSYIEHQKSMLKLKRCMERFDKRHKGGHFSFYYHTVVDVFNEQ